jgi:alkylation response protein AidB-like acyl-CoA dehydrogenase
VHPSYNLQVFANVDPSAGYKGITCFALSKDMGVEIAKKEAKVSLQLDSVLLYRESS